MQVNLADFSRFIASVTPWPGMKQRSPSKIWSKICAGYNKLLLQSLLSSQSWWHVLDSDHCFTCPDTWRGLPGQLAMCQGLKCYVTSGYLLFRDNPMESGKDEQSLNQVLGKMGQIQLLESSSVGLNLPEVLCGQREVAFQVRKADKSFPLWPGQH